MATVKKQKPAGAGAPALSDEEIFKAAVGEGSASIMAGASKASGKRCYRQAFSGAWQNLGPFEVTTQNELTELVKGFLAHLPSCKLPKGVTPEIAKDASQYLPIIADNLKTAVFTHNGKYVHADSQARMVVVAPGEPSSDSAYLGHAEAIADGQRALSASMVAIVSFTDAGRMFIANFRLCGRVTTLVQQLALRCVWTEQAFLACGVSADAVAAMQSSFSTAAAQSLRDAAIPGSVSPVHPQILWPEGNGDYVALSAISSQAVYNAILQAAATRTQERIPANNFMLGSGQAQNISVAVADCAGNLPVLRCVPPRIAATNGARLVRLAFAKQLIARLDAESLERFDQRIHPRTNQQRRLFLKGAAFAHASRALGPLLELRDELVADETLSFKMPQALPEEFIAVLGLDADIPLTDAVVDKLVRHVLEAGVQPILVRHTAEDIATYQQELRSAVHRLLNV